MTWRTRTTAFRDRDGWLATRREGLGASEVAALLGESPFAGPWDVRAAKDGGPEVKDHDDAPEGETGLDVSDPKLRGQILEPLVGTLYSAATGRKHLAIGDALGLPGHIAVTRHATEPWLRASLDATVYDDELGEGVGEWKTSRDSYKWGPSGAVLDGTLPAFDRVVPTHIGIQALVQLAVTGLAFCDVGVLTGGLAFRWFRVLRHEPTLDALVRVTGDLYHRQIVGPEFPDLDDSEACVRACRARLAENRTKSRRATVEETEWIYALVAKRDAETAANAARARILAAVGDCERLTLPPSGDGAARGVRVQKDGKVVAYGF